MDDIGAEYEALVQFLYMAPVGLVQTSLDGEIVMINPISAQLLMPMSRNGDLSNLFTALEGVAPDLRSQVQDFRADHGVICDAVALQVNAGVRGVSDPRMLSLTLVRLDRQRLMAVLNDITQQVKRERLLRQSEAWFNAVLTGISDYALARLDAQGRIEDWNVSIGRLTGFDAAALVGQPYSALYPADTTTVERVTDRLHEADRNGWSLDEGWRLRADGSRFWGSTMIVPLQVAAQTLPELVISARLLDDDDEHAYCLVIRDISDKREASERQRLSTMCDHLTGIANRRAFFEAAELEVERWRRAPRPLSMLMIDVDHFKRINDSHGHPGGDAVLRVLAGVLGANFRQVDVVARIGGEEFAVLLPSTDLHGACAVAERVRLAVAAHLVPFEGAQIDVTVSIGVAAMAGDVDGLDTLMRRADQALYRAKHNGRNRVEAASEAQAADGVVAPVRLPRPVH